MSLPSPTRRPFMLALLSLTALLIGFSLAGVASARPNSSASASNPQAPETLDAYAHFVPQAGAPPSGGTVSVGTKFTLDLKINTGSNNNITAVQNYVLFDNPNALTNVLKIIPSASASCSSIP